MTEFESRNRAMTEAMAADVELRRLTNEWVAASAKYEYTYHFTWLGLPVIQHPQDIVAMQELIWATKPDLIIETGVARGGSVVFYASMLELLGGEGRVIGVDIEIRRPNREALERHPLSARIDLIEGSSVEADVVRRVHTLAAGRDRVLVILDASHTAEHVLRELRSYAELVKPGGYVVVLDTVIEHMPEGSYPDRPWDRGDNPATAVEEFLRTDDRFEVDRTIEDRLLITAAPGGYLRRIGP